MYVYFFSFCMLRRKYSMKGSKRVLKYVRMLGNVPIDVLLWLWNDCENQKKGSKKTRWGDGCVLFRL